MSCVDRAKPEIVQRNVELLVSEGLGARAQADFQLATNTCRVLLKLADRVSPSGLKLAVRVSPSSLKPQAG